MENYKDNFGKLAIDKVTGFRGTIGGICFYAYGCAQYLITPRVDKDGKLVEGSWFDTSRIKVLEGDKMENLTDENPGCDSCKPSAH
jgi:hypothetical protein